MITTQFKDLNLSQLMLGTVQFGLDYGIANSMGQPSYQDVREILACAYEGGINCLDTAYAYGQSEEVLGKALRELGISDKVTVVSKVPPIEETLTSSGADRFIENAVVCSLKRLQLDVLPIYLFHRENNCLEYMDSLEKIRDKGLVKYIGSSTYTPDATGEIIASGNADALQVPASLLDQRFRRSGVFAESKNKGIAVFARSVYLQGLILMREEDVHPELRGVIPFRRRLSMLADDAGISLAELAVRYILSLEGITCAILGVDTVGQLRENLALFDRGALGADIINAIEAIVADIGEELILPTKWPDMSHRQRAQGSQEQQ